LVGKLTTEPSHSIIRASDVVCSRHYADECLQDIVADIAESVHSACEYTVRRAGIAPRAKQLAKNTYVLTNYSSLSVRCENDPSVPITTATCMPCLVRVQCKCRL